MSFGELMLVFGVIVIFVLPSLKDRMVNIRRLIILPVAFMYLLYGTITTNFHLLPTSYLAIAAGLLLGIVLGTFIRRNLRIKVDKEKSLILIPGNYITLTVFILIFCVEFVAHFLFAVHPGIKQAGTSQYLLLLALCTVSSLTVGSSICYFYKYFKAESVALEVKKSRQSV